MLTIKLIHADENFPSVLKEIGVFFSIDIIDFHDADNFWMALNQKFGIAISYFDDQIIRLNIIEYAIENSLFSLIERVELRAEIKNLFARAAKKRLGLVFICD